MIRITNNTMFKDFNEIKESDSSSIYLKEKNGEHTLLETKYPNLKKMQHFFKSICSRNSLKYLHGKKDVINHCKKNHLNFEGLIKKPVPLASIKVQEEIKNPEPETNITQVKTPKPMLQRIHRANDFTSAGSSNLRLELSDSTSVIFNKKTKKYVYISPAPPIENLVIPGGGAKGVILPGVLKAFENHKIQDLSFRDTLKNIAGASVGALTAALVATGMRAEEIITSMKNENFKDLLGEGTVKIALKNITLPIFKDAKPLLNLLRSLIQKSTTQNVMKMFGVSSLKDIKDPRPFVLAQLKKRNVQFSDEKVDHIINEMRFLIKTLQNPAPRQVRVTFAMLHALSELDPHTFKNLTVTAVSANDGQLLYFNEKNTPRLDIAIACRMSAALPGVLAPIQVPRRFFLPGYTFDEFTRIVDGGYLNNIPIEPLENKQGEKSFKNRGIFGQNLQTLVLVFDNSNRAEEESSPFYEVRPRLSLSSSLFDRVICNLFAKHFASINTPVRHTEAFDKKLEKIRIEYTQRNIPLYLPTLGTTDFDRAKQEEEIHLKQGEKQAKEYLENHRNELIYRTFDNMDALIKYMEPEEIEAHREQIAEFKKLTQKV